MVVDTAALSCILAPIVGKRSRNMRHNGGAAKVSRVLTMGCQSELVPNPQAETAPLRQGFNLHRSDHFVKRWGRQSHEKDTAVDPGASAGVGPTGLMIPSLHKVVAGTSKTERWLNGKASGCNPVALQSWRFESFPLHQQELTDEENYQCKTG